MQKRKIRWLCGVTALLLAGGVTALGFALKHEPDFYRHTQAPSNDDAKELAYAFARNFGQMLAEKEAKQEKWGCLTTEAELNCFLDHIFFERGEADDLRRLGISSPRVSLRQDHVRLAFRYGSGWFSTVLSYELNVWLVPKEPNTIAVEIHSARAGALPIAKQSILNQLSEIARKQNYKVTPYRHEGNPVILIDLHADQEQPRWLLTTLKLGDNTLKASDGPDQKFPSSLMIRGKTLDHALPLIDPSKVPKSTPLPQAINP